MLEPLQWKLVQVVVDTDYLHLDQAIILEQFKHELWIDEAAQVKYKVIHWDLKGLNLLLESELYVAFKHLGEIVGLKLLDSFHLHRVEVMAVVFAKISD